MIKLIMSTNIIKQIHRGFRCHLFQEEAEVQLFFYSEIFYVVVWRHNVCHFVRFFSFLSAGCSHDGKFNLGYNLKPTKERFRPMPLCSPVLLPTPHALVRSLLFCRLLSSVIYMTFLADLDSRFFC